MKQGIHPEYVLCRVMCACGETFETRAAVPEIKVEVCSKCHPFFTGRQKIVDTEGRVERFERRRAMARKPARPGEEEAEAEPLQGGQA